MNRNDYQSGWDTDQFPNNVPEMALAYYEVLKAGGFTTGGTNFDAKVRRQSLDPEDLILAHVGAMDVCARASRRRRGCWRTASWSGRGPSATRAGPTAAFSTTARGPRRARGREGIEPEPRSGRQERLENLVNRYL